MTKTNTTKTERALQRAWASAAKVGDQERLADLRAAFESLWPVDVRLTARAVERLEDEYPDSRGFTVLGRCRVVFHDPEDAREAADRLLAGADEAVVLAFHDVYSDLSLHQERFLERQVRDSIQRTARTLRGAADRVGHQRGF